jgi:hypothetical protein
MARTTDDDEIEIEIDAARIQVTMRGEVPKSHQSRPCADLLR